MQSYLKAILWVSLVSGLLVLVMVFLSMESPSETLGLFLEENVDTEQQPTQGGPRGSGESASGNTQHIAPINIFQNDSRPWCRGLASYEGTWRQHNSGSNQSYWWWEPSRCRYYHFSAKEALHCFKDSKRKAVVLGDSLLRNNIHSACRDVMEQGVEGPCGRKMVETRTVRLTNGATPYYFKWAPSANINSVTSVPEGDFGFLGEGVWDLGEYYRGFQR